MKIQEMIDRLAYETGIMLGRSKFYHYDREGIFGDLKRTSNNYRELTEKDYNKIKTVVLLRDVGIKLEDMFYLMKDTERTKKILYNKLQFKLKNINYLLDNADNLI